MFDPSAWDRKMLLIASIIAAQIVLASVANALWSNPIAVIAGLLLPVLVFQSILLRDPKYRRKVLKVLVIVSITSLLVSFAIALWLHTGSAGDIAEELLRTIE